MLHMNKASTPVKPLEFEKQLLSAASKGDIETLKESENEHEHTEAWGKALSGASANGHHECVTFILDRPGISQADRDIALVKSSSRGQVSCMKPLVTAQCSTEARNLALETSAAHGFLEYVKAILPFSEKSHDSFWPARMAASNNHADCLAILMPDSDNVTLTNGTLAGAASSGYLECVRILLDSNKCSTEDKLKALFGTTKEDDNDIIKLLLDDDYIKTQCATVDEPIFSSIVASNVNILDALLSLLKEDIGKDDGKELLMLATSNESPKCLKLLLRETTLKPTMRHVSNAVDLNRPECLKLLSPIVNLDDVKDCIESDVLMHPLVVACFYAQPKSISTLAAHTNAVDIINVALLNGARACLEGTGKGGRSSLGEGISREDLAPLLKKTTHKDLANILAKAKASPEKYIIDPGKDSQVSIFRYLEKELEILRRRSTLCGSGSGPSRTRRASL